MCRACVEWRDWLVGMKILNDALRNQDKGENETRGEKDPESAASDVHPEIAYGLRVDAGDSANQRDGECDTDSRGSKIVIREAGHLREVAHGGLGDVGLPVGIGSEAYRGVPRKSRRDAGESMRIERAAEEMLRALDDIENRQRDTAEEKHGDAVLLPVHFIGLIDAAKAIDQALDGAAERIEKCFVA